MSETNSFADQNTSGAAVPTLTVDLWADFVCPWCYLGERRFFLALSQFEHANRVTVRRHPFELDADAESCGSERMVDVIQAKYDIDSERAHALETRLAQLCSEVSLEYSGDRILANTLDAHRLVALAQELDEAAKGNSGRAAALAERLYRGHFVEQACLGDRDTLKSIALDAGTAHEVGSAQYDLETNEAGGTGLPEDQIDALYASDRYTNEVRMDSHQALELGAEGVPFFVFDSRLAIAGAQASEVFLEALNKAWHEMTPQ